MNLKGETISILPEARITVGFLWAQSLCTERAKQLKVSLHDLSQPPNRFSRMWRKQQPLGVPCIWEIHEAGLAFSCLWAHCKELPCLVWQAPHGEGINSLSKAHWQKAQPNSLYIPWQNSCWMVDANILQARLRGKREPPPAGTAAW